MDKWSGRKHVCHYCGVEWSATPALDDEEAALAYTALQEAIRQQGEPVTITASLARYLADSLVDHRSAEVQRYRWTRTDMDPDPDGDWVRFVR